FLKLFVTFDSTFYFTSCFTLLFEAFISALKRGGHFSDFKLAVKRLFKRFLLSPGYRLHSRLAQRPVAWRAL
ncbi:hypothetical protein, partial [Alishewanella longhuensis]|uniref:hypothetical protein n=1 Tax=Alishewanella longhuensis TaxID=1091037 RepID=UPI001E5FD75C